MERRKKRLNKVKDEPGCDVDDCSWREKTTEELHLNNVCVFGETTGRRSEATFSEFLTGKEFTPFDKDAETKERRPD